MNKYAPLTSFLNKQSGPVQLSFDRLNDIVPGGLPASAYKYDAWWSNDDPTHTQSGSWDAAGYTARPDRSRGVVWFDPFPDRG